MCDEQAIGVGDLVPNERIVFRLCSRKNFLNPSRDAVQPEAFYKDGTNHKDGLSLALELANAARAFPKNHGAIRIRVQDIHDLDRGLEVRFDTQEAGHVLIRNMACMDRGSDERVIAEATAAELALRAGVESPTRVSPPASIDTILGHP